MHINDLPERYKALLSQNERETAFAARGNYAQMLILMLRKLTDSRNTILYREVPGGEYDSSDFCMEATDIFAYREDTDYEAGFYREVGHVITDRAAMLVLNERRPHEWSPTEVSYGSITDVYSETITAHHAWKSCKQLLRNAAATSNLRLSFPQTNPSTFIVRVWNEMEGTPEDIAKVWVEANKGRDQGSFALELL